MTDQSKLSLRSLTIHRYEQFLNCPRIEFSPDDNLILGINGSGKTSLLRLLAAVLRWNYDALIGQPFNIEFEQVLDEGLDTKASISGHVKYEPTPFGADESSTGRRVARSKYDGFEAQFDIRIRAQAFTVKVTNSRFSLSKGNQQLGGDEPVEPWLASQLMGKADDMSLWPLVERTGNTFVIRETDIDFTELTNSILYDFYLERRSAGRPSDVALSREFLSNRDFRQWHHLVSTIMLETEEQQGEQGYLPPVTFRQDGTGPRFDLSKMLMALDAESISFRLKIEQTQSIDERTVFEGKGVEIRVRFSSGTEVIDSRLTFGQKRLITIALGALLCGGSPLLVDEIDNGLHPGLLETVIGLIRSRQTFIASHNKLVVDLLDYESPEDICRTIHICRRNQDGTQSLVALSDDQVREVFEKIEVGLMNPSDVLQREGLW